MQYQPKTIRLRDGSQALFRQPTPQDAAGMVQYMKTCYAQTPYLLHSPEDFQMTEEREAAFLEKVLQSEYDLMIVCEIDGRSPATASSPSTTNPRPATAPMWPSP